MKNLTSIATHSDRSHYIDAMLAQAIEKIDALDQHRIQRALASNNTHFKHVFYLLPLLLHYNLPELPAYVENAPYGLAKFTFNPYQKRFFNTLISETERKEVADYAFDGLYSMGSTGSIVQTTKSDLDLWLCFSRVEPRGLPTYRAKTRQINPMGERVRH